MSERNTLYIALISIVIATFAIGLSYYKTPGPAGPEGPVGPAGPAGPAGPQGPAGVVNTSYIAPGLGFNLEVKDVTIGTDGLTKVTMEVTDGQGQPMTASDFSATFMLASLATDSSGNLYYNNYFKSTDEGAAYTYNGVTKQPVLASVNEPDRDSGGSWEQTAPGQLVYTFGKAVPSGYDASATHVLAIYAYPPDRNAIANVAYAFVPNGGTPDDTLLTSDTETCNKCHDPLAAHGGPRQEYVVCLVCHTPDAVDPETGNSLDMKVMIHKIHLGKDLPSVQAGEPYYIVGHSQSVADYSAVAFPADAENCEFCHTGPDASLYKTNPSRAACGSCHDNVDFAAGVNHLVQTDDKSCGSCHPATMTNEFDLSVPGAHVIPNFSSQLPGCNFEILSVTNTGPGQKPVVKYTVKTDAGEVIPLSDIDTATFVSAGPTTDYSTYWRESNVQTNSVDNGDGTYTYTFTTAIPSDAKGSWAISVEGRTIVNINDGKGGTLAIRDTTSNPMYYVPVTDTTAVPRRTIVSQDNCDSCHKDLYLHGGNRKSVDYCSTCHMPLETDESVRPADAMPPVTIDFKYMIHRIHLGEEQSTPYIIYGHGGSLNDFSEILYSANLQDCAKCHVDDSYELPLQQGVLPTTVKEEGAVVSVTPPVTSVCTSCHDSQALAAHAELMTTSSGVESCAVCHGQGKESDVATAHMMNVKATVQLTNLY